MTRIYIVEDNSSHLELLKIKVEMIGYEVVGSIQTAANALSEIQETNPDVVLVDINLARDKDGITLAHEINEFTDAVVIFITSQSEDEVIHDAVTAKPSSYLIKPIDPDVLKANIELAMYKRNAKQSQYQVSRDYMTVRTGEKLHLIQFKQVKILKVEIKNYVTLIDDQNKQYVVRDSLKNLLTHVLPPVFIRTHHGYAVNLEFLAFVDDKEQTVYLSTNDTVPIGKSYRKEVYKKLNIKN